MAMTLRLPDNLNRALDDIANAEHTPKSALVAEAVRQFIDRRAREARIEEGFAFALTHDREAIDRLADA
ncbi:ribbon-helix-helix protein, CopG family [Tersicoccus sp. MR15.9]|uniref:CopG family ribbon-helix-helix protein n=1 Tax=Tersicoccus mangrovi TaxID=3121635 RepID=UPI002FE64ACF